MSLRVEPRTTNHKPQTSYQTMDDGPLTTIEATSRSPLQVRGGVTPEDARAERARRELARRRFLDFSCYVAPWYEPAAHHRLVAKELEQVARYIETKGKEGTGRLMIFLPPREGKTEQVSRLFPSWVLGKLPNSRIILTSYGADLAMDNSRAARAYVTGDRYAAIFGRMSVKDQPVELSEDTRSKANWDLAQPHRGGVVAAGVGGGITGKGAHLLVIDDPFKNREEADSEAHRERVMSWYKSSAYTRLEEGGAIIIVHTRWHPEDLAGQLLMAMGEWMPADEGRNTEAREGQTEIDPTHDSPKSEPSAQDDMRMGMRKPDDWKVIFLPALALPDEDYCKSTAEMRENLLRGVYIPEKDPLGRKPGEALWPERYPVHVLESIRANILDSEFISLYQQMPRARTGGFFDEADFDLIAEMPDKDKDEGKSKGLRWMRYIDLALGESKTSDWNTCLAVAMDGQGEVYARDMLRIHELTEFMEQLKSWMLSEGEKGTVWGVEMVAFQSLVLRELMRDPKLANVAIVPIKPDGDKVQRARPLQARCKQKKVHLVRGAWVQSFMNEVLSFPRGKHDDQVDTFSGGLQMVARYGQMYNLGEAESYQG